MESSLERVRGIIERLEADATLDDGEQFVARVDALDALEVLRLDGLADAALTARVDALERRLAAVDMRWFDALRTRIRAGDYDALRQCFARAASQMAHDADDDPGYDELDLLLNGLLEGEAAPGDATVHDAEMVFYQPTPMRVHLELVAQLDVTAEDVFVDLGSGLGQTPILMHLLTGVRAWGVEIEAAYVDYARACAERLGVRDVTFLHADARDADLTDATVFYLYTPFTGSVLRQVLDTLAAQAAQRPIRVCTYGPCSDIVAQEPWLRAVFARGAGESRFAIFAGL